MSHLLRTRTRSYEAFRDSLPTNLLGLDRSMLEQVTRRVRLRRGQTIGGPGEPCAELFLIHSGQILTRSEQLAGIQAINILGPGELFGEKALFAPGVWDGSATALADGEAFALAAVNIPRLAIHYPNCVTELLALLGQRISRAESLASIRAAGNASDRMLQFLREMAVRFGEPFGDEIWLPLRLTQSEFAEILGLARETVVRIQSQLVEQGMIRRDSRRGYWLRQAGRQSIPAQPSTRTRPDTEIGTRISGHFDSR